MTPQMVMIGAYAVFECSVDAIGGTYQHVFTTWLPSATVQFDNARPSFEQFRENLAERPVRLYQTRFKLRAGVNIQPGRRSLAAIRQRA